MRVARNPQGSTPSFGRAPVVRFETCAHRARILQPKNLMRVARNPKATTDIVSVETRRNIPATHIPANNLAGKCVAAKWIVIVYGCTKTCAHRARILQPKNLILILILLLILFRPLLVRDAAQIR